MAAPDIVSDKRYSSGLVLDFQQSGGQLIAGGNTKVRALHCLSHFFYNCFTSLKNVFIFDILKVIRCWDVATEKCCNTFDSKSDASLTTLTTAWDYDISTGYSGLGPNIVIAGYGNGSLRVFDTRAVKGGPVLYINEGFNRQNLTRRRKHTEFDEHTSWIVDVSFTTYGGRNEVSLCCLLIVAGQEEVDALIFSLVLYNLSSDCFWLRRRKYQVLGLALFKFSKNNGTQNANYGTCCSFERSNVCHWFTCTIH